MKDFKILAHVVWQCECRMNSELKKGYWGGQFWGKRYWVSTIGLDGVRTRK